MALDPAIAAFAWAPDWSELVRERIEFRTDLLSSEDRSVQARSTRLTPRRTFEFQVAELGASRTAMVNQVWGLGAAKVYLPLWTEGATLQAPLAAGAAVLPVATTDLDHVAGGVVMLRGQTADQVELVQADTIGASIGLAAPTARAWPAGTVVLPCRLAFLDPDFSLGAFNRSLTYGRIRFQVAEANPYSADAGATLYRGLPVLTSRPSYARNPETAYDRDLTTVDDGLGLVTRHDPVGAPQYRQVHDWALDTRARQVAFRKLVYALRGKRGRVWVPTFLDDLAPVAPVTAVGNSLRVAWTGYAANVAQGLNRRDLRIELATGAVLYRRVVSSVDNGDGTETLGLDAAFGTAVAVAGFAQVSFMGLCRSDSDAFEFGWWTGDYADVSTAWRAQVHDV